jgi:hypothetical protein
MVIMSIGLTALLVSLVTIGVSFGRLPADARQNLPVVFWVLFGMQTVALMGLWPVAVLCAFPTLGLSAWFGLNGDQRTRALWGALAVAASSWFFMIGIGGAATLLLMPSHAP